MGKTIFECAAKAVKDNGKKIKCTVKLCSDSLTLDGNFGSTFSHGIQFNNLRILTSRLGKEKLGLTKKNCVFFEYNSRKNVIKVFIKKLKNAEEFANKFEESKAALIAKDVATYQDALKQMEKNSITGFESAIKLFNSINYHADSNTKIKHCEDRITEIKESQEKQRKNDIYYRAVTLMKNDKKADYQSAIKLLETILDWKDSKNQVNTCKTKIAEIDRNESLYQAAKNLMKKNAVPDLENAVSMFKSIINWKDSNQLKQKCEARINDLIYDEASRLMKTAKNKSSANLKIRKYTSAVGLFEKIGEWKDSKKLIYDCKESIKRTIEYENKRKDEIYSDSIALMEVDTIDSYTKAEKKLLDIKEWKDASEKIKICRNKIAEIKKKLEKERKEKLYQQALVLKSNNNKNDFRAALEMFKSIKDWKDSAQLLQECKNEIEKIEKAEELQRKENEKQALINSESDANEIEKNKKTIKSGIGKIYEPFLNNPYYILGISCRSTKTEALSVQDKIEKFAKLGKADLYKSKYDLRDIEKPNRDLSNIQSATMEINNINHKWFWYISSDYCKLWKLSFIFGELDICDKQKSEYYDTLLSCYFKMLVEHADLSMITLWAKLIRHLDTLISIVQSPDGIGILKNRFNKDELAKYSDAEIISSFTENIFKPIIEIINNANIIQLQKFLKDTTVKSSVNLEPLLKCVSERILVCMKDGTQEIKDAVDGVANREAPKQSELNLIEKSLECFKNTTYGKLSALEKNLNKMYIDRIYGIFRDAIWSALAIYENAKQLKKVFSYAMLIYEHCDGDDKRTLRNSFAEYDMNYFEKDFSDQELAAYGLKYLLGEGAAKDPRRGINYISKAANNGYVDAQCLYGLCYLEGEGVSQSNYTAKDWLLRAARQNNSVAMYNLCKVYIAEYNLPEIKKWAIKSAKLGNEDALEFVKKMIADGMISRYELDRY